MSDELLITHKRIDLSASAVLYHEPFAAGTFQRDWIVRSGQWHVDGDALVGRNPLPQPGCIQCRREFPGNVILDFRAQTLAPCTHDIDVMWNFSWDEQVNKRGDAYVAGIAGWWDRKVGFEKSPQYKLLALAPCPWFEPGHAYRIQVGSVDGHCFLFVDGQLRLEMMDPQPIDATRHAHVGFEAYQSLIRVSDLTVRQVNWSPRQQVYPQEF